MDIRLSGLAFRAPEPTAVFSVATSDAVFAVITQRDLLRRFRYTRIVRPPRVVRVASPVELSGPTTVIADSRVVQRKERSRLRPPAVVGAQVVVVVVYSGPKTRLARTPRIYGRATPRWVSPVVVFAPPRAQGWVAVQLVRRPRPSTMWIQREP